MTQYYLDIFKSQFAYFASVAEDSPGSAMNHVTMPAFPATNSMVFVGHVVSRIDGR